MKKQIFSLLGLGLVALTLSGPVHAFDPFGLDLQDSTGTVIPEYPFLW